MYRGQRMRRIELLDRLCPLAIFRYGSLIKSFLQSWQAACLVMGIQTREYAFYRIYPLGWL
jgi:hypothetical protein